VMLVGPERSFVLYVTILRGQRTVLFTVAHIPEACSRAVGVKNRVRGFYPQW